MSTLSVTRPYEHASLRRQVVFQPPQRSGSSASSHESRPGCKGDSSHLWLSTRRGSKIEAFFIDRGAHVTLLFSHANAEDARHPPRLSNRFVFPSLYPFFSPSLRFALLDSSNALSRAARVFLWAFPARGLSDEGPSPESSRPFSKRPNVEFFAALPLLQVSMIYSWLRELSHALPASKSGTWKSCASWWKRVQVRNSRPLSESLALCREADSLGDSSLRNRRCRNGTRMRDGRLALRINVCDSVSFLAQY